MWKDKGNEIVPKAQLVGVALLAGWEIQPNKVISLDPPEYAFLAHKDLLENERSEAEIKRLHEELEATRREAQTYKDELAGKAELEKKLTKETKRCQALRKKMKQEMNASQAKYKDQIRGLKNEIERAKVDL
ncbi:hypothetical protein ACOSP7_006736 [Xanthoceras sorbifolium]